MPSSGSMCRHAFRVDDPVSVLAPHGSAKHIFRTVRLDSVQNLCLLIADSIGLKRDRRLHGGEADELHDVIGHHVTESTGVVIIAATLLNPDGLSNRDLYVVDVTAVPDRLENPVGKSERQNV